MEFEIGKIIATIINFLILLFILRKFFWSKLEAAINAREEFVLEKINSANAKEEKAGDLLLEKENLLKEARLEGKKITEKRKNQADRIHDEIINEAKKVAKSIEEKSKEEIEREKAKAMEEIKVQTVDLAIALSKKVVDEELDNEKQKKVIDKFIAELEV